MQIERRLGMCVVLTVVALCLVAPSSEAATDCTRLRYQTGKDFATGGSKGLAQFSLRPSDITVDNLVCLVERFREHNPAWTDVILFFFTSFEAADNWMAYREMIDFERPRPFEKWDTQLRAVYSLDLVEHEEYLQILPFGWQKGVPSEYETRIDLPLASKPHCRFEISGRCLLAFEKMDDPAPEPNIRLSGTVTLTGTIRRDGKLAHLHVGETRSDPSDREGQLVRAVLNNLKTWWLEPSRLEHKVRITYASGSDSWLPDRGGLELKLELPNQITIRAMSTK